MLFYIDQSIAHVANSANTGRDDIIIAVEFIAQARREGKHLVFGDRDTIGALKRNLAISSIARQVYTKLYERLPQDKTYFDRLTCIVHVIADRGMLEMVNSNGKNVIKISAEYLQDFELLNETVLLSENQDDTEFYEFLGKSYIAFCNFGQIAIRYKSQSGNGQNTHREYNALQTRRNKLCLCILDGDIKYQGASFGDTARAVQRIDDPNQPLCKLLVLSAHEIENIIPTSIYRDVTIGDPNRSRAIYSLEIIEASSSEARRYLDFKKGLKLYEYQAMNVNTPHYHYWQKVITDVNAPTVCCATSKCERKEECSCFIFHGFGSSILSAVIAYLKQKSIAEIEGMVDDITKAEWISLGEIILAWCCGSARLSAS